MKTRCKNIELASQSKVDKLGGFVDRVLKALGHSEALVTDESMVGDFLDVFDKTRAAFTLDRVSKKLGFKVRSSDYIWMVAKKIEKRVLKDIDKSIGRAFRDLPK